MIGYGLYSFSNSSDITIQSRVNPVFSQLTNYYSGDSVTTDKKSSSNGTLINGATYGIGKNNNCFSLDGVNDYLSFPSDFFEPNGSFSFNCWFNTSSTSILTLLCLTNASGYLGIRVYLGGASRSINFSKFPISTTINTLSSSGGVYTNGAWNMLTIVNDISVGMLIYCNGSLITSNATTSSVSWGSSTIQRLGANYDGGTPFNGLIDEVSFFNSALSLANHQTLYNSGSGIFY